MCKIDKKCTCQNLSHLVYLNEKSSFRLKKFFKEQEQEETYTFLIKAKDIEKLSDKSVIDKCNKLAEKFLLQEITTSEGGYILQPKNNGFCPNTEVVRQLQAWLINLKGKKDLGKLGLDDIGELKNRLQKVVEQVQHRVFQVLSTNELFVPLTKPADPGVNAIEHFKTALKLFRDGHTSHAVDDLMGQLNMKSTPDVAGENSKNSKSISH